MLLNICVNEGIVYVFLRKFKVNVTDCLFELTSENADINLLLRF